MGVGQAQEWGVTGILHQILIPPPRLESLTCNSEISGTDSRSPFDQVGALLGVPLQMSHLRMPPASSDPAQDAVVVVWSTALVLDRIGSSGSLNTMGKYELNTNE